jgi:hypothetical protein
MADAELLSALRDSARGVVADYCDGGRLRRFVDVDGAPFDRDLWSTAAELGWLMLAAPEAHDGMGAGLAEAAVLQQELGRGPAPIPFAPSYLAARALALWPVDGPAAALFPGLSSGETAAAFALESAALKAEKSGDGWRV